MHTIFALYFCGAMRYNNLTDSQTVSGLTDFLKYNLKGSEMEEVKKIRRKPIRKKPSVIFMKNLRALLTEKELSQRGAAEIMGISVSVVHDWLQGSYPNDPDAILKLCKATGADFQWLLTGLPTSKSQSTAPLSEIFNIEHDSSFSGIFMIEAKRLKKKDCK